MTTETKKTVAALTVGGNSLVSISPTALLYSSEVTLEAMRPFVGRRIEVQTVRAHETEWVTLESVTQNRETGNVVFWAVPDSGHGYHLSPRSRRK